jgi:hypothetical protein
MGAVVDAADAGSARGILEGAVARNGDVCRQLAFSIVPLE